MSYQDGGTKDESLFAKEQTEDNARSLKTMRYVMNQEGNGFNLPIDSSNVSSEKSSPVMRFKRSTEGIKHIEMIKRS